jgi:hypothetical protein
VPDAAPVLVLIHSPLVGSLSWQPAADRLRAQGHRVVVPPLADVLSGQPPLYEHVGARTAAVVAQEAPTAQGAILVGHSGAGALLPSVAGALRCPVRRSIFVDAILPHPNQSWLDTAPPPLQETVRGMARDGVLPSWHLWFPPGTIERLIPDPVLRERFVVGLPQVPLAYFEEVAPMLPERVGSMGYLRLSAAYDAVADEAERRGWPTLREDADHLSILTAPDWIVDRLIALIGLLDAAA